MATSTVEDYLKQISLEEQRRPGKRVGMGRIASALELTPGTVTTMVKTLADSGLVDYEPYSGVLLTDSGRQLALHVLRRHRLIELFLVQVMGMDWSEVHTEAERLEHAISDRLVELMDEMLGRPTVDPHGDPIPTAGGEVATMDHLSLARAQPGDSVVVARVLDQSAEFLKLLEREGVTLGSRLRVVELDRAADSIALVVANGESMSLGLRAAVKILVEPETAS
ncbi:MAG: metal-dependent transcriptional regulator [Thermoanaerobaculia bacterium]